MNRTKRGANDAVKEKVRRKSFHFVKLIWTACKSDVPYIFCWISIVNTVENKVRMAEKKKFQPKENIQIYINKFFFFTPNTDVLSLIGINVSQDGCKFFSTLKQLTCLSCESVLHSFSTDNSSKKFKMCENWLPLLLSIQSYIRIPLAHNNTKNKGEKIRTNKWLFVIESTIYNLSSHLRICSYFPLWWSSNNLSCQSVSVCFIYLSVPVILSCNSEKYDSLRKKIPKINRRRCGWGREEKIQTNFINFVRLTHKSM